MLGRASFEKTLRAWLADLSAAQLLDQSVSQTANSIRAAQPHSQLDAPGPARRGNGAMQGRKTTRKAHGI